MASKRVFSDEDVKLARKAYAERERLLEEAEQLTISNLAKKFGVTYSTMWDILNYATYRNVM